ncbi:MAG TPA: hypothetical protein DCE23_04035 [Firmicutes bacterium]|nr:hypothetical protein [Bacillota bacterium]
MEGWIKLHRKTLDNPIITKDSDYLAVWIYLLLNTTHKEYDVLFKGERITLKKGQLLTGRKSISEKLKIDENKVQRILKTLENEHQIEQQSSNKNRLITIVSWDKYQQDEQQDEQQVNNNRTTSEQQVNTNKNVKNIKNDKNVITTIGDSCVDGLQDVIDFYQDNIGLITPYAVEVFTDYAKEMPCDVIVYAMKKAVEANVRTIQYIKGTLNNWQNAGVKTLIQAEEESQKFKNNKQEPKKEESEEEKIQRRLKEMEALANDKK